MFFMLSVEKSLMEDFMSSSTSFLKTMMMAMSVPKCRAVSKRHFGFIDSQQMLKYYQMTGTADGQEFSKSL